MWRYETTSSFYRDARVCHRDRAASPSSSHFVLNPPTQRVEPPIDRSPNDPQVFRQYPATEVLISTVRASTQPLALPIFFFVLFTLAFGALLYLLEVTAKFLIYQNVKSHEHFRRSASFAFGHPQTLAKRSGGGSRDVREELEVVARHSRLATPQESGTGAGGGVERDFLASPRCFPSFIRARPLPGPSSE